MSIEDPGCLVAAGLLSNNFQTNSTPSAGADRLVSAAFPRPAAAEDPGCLQALQIMTAAPVLNTQDPVISGPKEIIPRSVFAAAASEDGADGVRIIDAIARYVLDKVAHEPEGRQLALA